MRNARTPDRAPLFSEIYRAPASRKSNRRYGLSIVARRLGSPGPDTRQPLHPKAHTLKHPFARTACVPAAVLALALCTALPAHAQETAADAVDAAAPVTPKEPLPLWEI